MLQRSLYVLNEYSGTRLVFSGQAAIVGIEKTRGSAQARQSINSLQ